MVRGMLASIRVQRKRQQSQLAQQSSVVQLQTPKSLDGKHILLKLKPLVTAQKACSFQPMVTSCNQNLPPNMDLIARGLDQSMIAVTRNTFFSCCWTHPMLSGFHFAGKAFSRPLKKSRESSKSFLHTMCLFAIVTKSATQACNQRSVDARI